MNSDNQQVIYCEDGEYRVCCSVCDILCIERFYKNHLKSRFHIIKFFERQKIDKSFQIVS